MNDFKIIFAGPVGSGKTTAIATLSDEAPVCTNQSASDMTRMKKSETTVAMDYGSMTLDAREKIHLYGTPDRETVKLVHDKLKKNCIGLILLINNMDVEPVTQPPESQTKVIAFAGRVHKE